ncbi:MAG: thiol-disulfide oxidoreductase DCC family protein [Phycisphaerales bacterium]|nr:thiol-disulfide oxidoreductase DCC family protein [Phycisphaerales bacterium]
MMADVPRNPDADLDVQTTPVVLFDGVCTLCNSAVRFIIRHDRAGRFRFASLQSHAAARLLEGREGMSPPPDSMIVIDGEGIHTRSDAALRVARGLAWPWCWVGLGRCLPRWCRDPVYAFIARHRYRWFGRSETCMVPTDDVRGRFLDDG